jgi:ABC-type polysaccharide/polyol phosphate transport system ATPase subunit
VHYSPTSARLAFALSMAIELTVFIDEIVAVGEPIP